MRLTDKEGETMYKGFSEYGKRISVYAAYKDREYFAESFLSYHMGEKIIDPELRKFFDSLKVKDAKPVTKPVETKEKTLHKDEPVKVPKKAKELISHVEETHIARKEAAKIYSFTKNEIEGLKAHGIELKSTDVYISDNRILHALRNFKVSLGKAVSMDELRGFIDSIYSCEMFFDEEKQNIVFVTNQNNKTQKFIVEPNYKLKANGEKIITNAFVTAGLVKEHNIRQAIYKKIR